MLAHSSLNRSAAKRRQTEEPTYGGVMQMVGKWQAQHECCFVIRGSDAFANGVDKGDDVCQMLAVASGRYYK